MGTKIGAVREPPLQTTEKFLDSFHPLILPYLTLPYFTFILPLLLSVPLLFVPVTPMYL